MNSLLSDHEIRTLVVIYETPYSERGRNKVVRNIVNTGIRDNNTNCYKILESLCEKQVITIDENLKIWLTTDGELLALILRRLIGRVKNENADKSNSEN
jgi:hypothetical protein